MRKSAALRHLGLLMILLLAAVALSAQSQSQAVDVEVGYRFVDVTGNERLYRTQINDRQGILLRSLLYDSQGPLGGLDFFKMEASDMGAGPAGSFRLAAGRTNIFRLDFTYRRQDLYSALVDFANPFFNAGVTVGQHTYNRVRDIYDVNVQILPGKMITPILGYTRNTYSGPGTTTYNVGGDDFALNQNLTANDQEYRIGLLFNVGPVQGGVTQGWRQYRENDAETLVPGAGAGNNPGTVLGQPISATGITRSTNTSIDTPATSAWVSGRFFDRVKVTGSYVHASPDGDTTSAETDAGQFVSFQILRFFTGLNNPITSKTDWNWWRGMARAEIAVLPGVDVVGGWTERSGTLDGTALITSLYQNTVTFAGQPMGDLLKVLATSNSIDRTQRVYDASVSATVWSPLRLNAGWSQAYQNVTVNQDAAEIIIAGGQSGTYHRTVNTWGGGATFTMAGLTLGGEYHADDGDQLIFRNDYINRDRWKVRAAYNFGDIVRLGGTWQETHAKNESPDIRYDTKVQEAAADIQINAVPKILTLHGSAGYFQADRKILERAPQDFSVTEASQGDLGHTWEGGATLTFDRFTLDGGYLSFTNNGSVPLSLMRIRIHAEVSLTANFSVTGEWLKDQYKESFVAGQSGPLSNYDANRYYAGLRWKL